jgi:hypothetical protein
MRNPGAAAANSILILEHAFLIVLLWDYQDQRK